MNGKRSLPSAGVPGAGMPGTGGQPPRKKLQTQPTARLRSVPGDSGCTIHVVLTMKKAPSPLPALARAYLGVEDTDKETHSWYAPQCRGYTKVEMPRLVTKSNRSFDPWDNLQVYLNSFRSRFEVIVIEVGGERLLEYTRVYSALEEIFSQQKTRFFQGLRFEVVGVGCDLHAAPSQAMREFQEWCSLRQAGAAQRVKQPDNWILRFRDLFIPDSGLFHAGQPLYFFNKAFVCLKVISEFVDETDNLWAKIETQLAYCCSNPQTDSRLSEIFHNRHNKPWLQEHFSSLAGYFVITIHEHKPSLPVPRGPMDHIRSFLEYPARCALCQVSRPLHQQETEARMKFYDQLDTQALELAEQYMLPEHLNGLWRKIIFDAPGKNWIALIRTEVKQGIATVALEKKSGGVAATILKAILAFHESARPILTNAHIQQWVRVRLANFACAGAYRLLQHLGPERLANLASPDGTLDWKFDIYWDYLPYGDNHGSSRLFCPHGLEPPVNKRARVQPGGSD